MGATDALGFASEDASPLITQVGFGPPELWAWEVLS